MDKQAAQKAVKQGAVVAFVLAGLTFLVVLYAVLSNADGTLKPWNHPLNFMYAALVAGCGVAILRYFRAAAVALFFWYLFVLIEKIYTWPSQIYIWIDVGWPAGIFVIAGIIGIVLVLVVLYFFWRAIQGTFAYHKLRRDEDPNYRPVSRWSYIVGIPLGIIVITVTGWGLMMELGVVPSAEVLAGDEVPQKDKALLLNKGILLPNEKIQLFNSSGFISVLENGNILTDKRIISYEQQGGELQVYATPIEDVVEVKLTQKGDPTKPTMIEVWTNSGDGFLLVVPTENDGDTKFLKAIEQRLSSAPNKSLSPTQ